MAQKKDNLPVNAEPAVKDGGSITYANEVIAIISGIAASEIEGIAGMVTAGGLGEIISKNRNITRGVKVEVGTEEVSVDLYTIVEYGQPIQKVAAEVQENVRKSIESMTGLRVVRVDIHVQGVSFEKDKQDAQNRLEAANVQHLSSPQPEKKAKKAEKEIKTAEEVKPQAAVENEEPVEAVNTLPETGNSDGIAAEAVTKPEEQPLPAEETSSAAPETEPRVPDMIEPATNVKPEEQKKARSANTKRRKA